MTHVLNSYGKNHRFTVFFFEKHEFYSKKTRCMYFVQFSYSKREKKCLYWRKTQENFLVSREYLISAVEIGK